MKKKIRYFALVIFIVIIVFVILAVVDIKKHEKVYTSKEITVVKKAEHTAVKNPRIVEIDDILYSENGDIYDGFQNSGYNYYSSKFDGTAMVVTSEDKLYYVDGYLDPYYLSESRSRAIISKKADFVLYNDRDELQCGCVYDASTGRKIPIYSQYIPLSDSAISSNGRYVAFYDKEHGTIIKDVQNPDSYTIVSKRDLDAIAVSPDGERAFFEIYDDETHFAFSFHDGELFEVARGGYFHYVVNDECTEAFVSNNNQTFYYDIHMENGQKVLEDDIYRVHCVRDPLGIDGKYSSIKIADVETFRGCIIDTVLSAYYFYSPYKSLVELDEYRTYDYLGFEDGVVYRLYDNVEDYLCIDIMNDGCVTSSKIEGIDITVRSFEAADNLSKIYYIDRDDNIWLYENGDNKLLYNSPNLRSYIQYDRFSGRLFFIDNNNLCSIGDNPDDYRIELNEVDFISKSYYEYEDFVVCSYQMQKRYARVFGNIMLIGS